MKRISFIIALVILAVAVGFFAKRRYYDPDRRLHSAREEVRQLTERDELKSGDIIFQTSRSGQSNAIQLATHSTYSHCGIIFKEGGTFYVYEAAQHVMRTPLDTWIARGQDGKFVIKRLVNANDVLTPSTLARMIDIEKQFHGKDYDLTFEWSDDRMYCSELVWKIYQRATGIEIGKLEKLRDFDLTAEAVRNKLHERYGDKIPTTETVISPASMFESKLLTTVWSNY